MHGTGKIRLANYLIQAESQKCLLHHFLLSDAHSMSLTICNYLFHITARVLTMSSI